jgi:hypothetical protein
MGKMLGMAVALVTLAGSARASEEPQELSEGLPHAVDVALQLRYERAVDGRGPSGLANVGVFGVRARAYLGDTAAYTLGLDLDLGGADTGFVYRLDAQLLGFAVRFAGTGVVALGGGVGLSGVAGGVPIAAEFPVELQVAITGGPVRVTAWLDAAWIAGAESRRKGSPSFDFVDAMSAGLAFRIGGDSRYWRDMRAGGGPAFGVMYREALGLRFVGGFVALSLAGGQ